MKPKKVTKMRGSKTHGYGSKKKHRGAGSRGGRGMAGVFKHRKFWIMKNAPGHIGKRGFKTLGQRKVVAAKPKTLNIRDIERLADGKKEIDVTKLGFEKVLGTGEIKKPITVRAKFFSETAKAKIEESKGKAIVIEN
jgi:large subunit ribosomal protein L15